MRRSAAISQVLLLLAFYLVPLAATSSAGIPACCRRDGAHHCTMQQSAGAADQAAFRNAGHCPYRLPVVALTHATKLFKIGDSFAEAAPGSPEFLNFERNRTAATRLSTGLDSRGPPALSL